MTLGGRSVVVVGLGESGIAAAELCVRQGARVVATDSAPLETLRAEAKALAGRGVQIVTGALEEVSFKDADLVVVSPGVPPSPIFEALERRNVEVIGELELASRFVSAPIVAIGGTNGKSTTTTLAAEMLAAAGKKVFAGGNLGIPLSRATTDTYDVLVVEVSSFQAERAPTFHPAVAALLNITDDHLDRYPSFSAYAAAKGNMFVSQTSDDVAVVPKGDAIVFREASRGEGRTVTFGPKGDISLSEEAIVDRLRERSFPLRSIKLRGTHNLLNVCAAIACASEAGASEEAIRSVLERFEGLPHRTTLVAQIGGVRYYDDSKGTNVGATVAAVRGLSEPRVVLIAGGRDKLGAYEPLAAELAGKGRALVVLGEAADKIAAAAEGKLPVEKVANLDEAVQRARALAQPGDAVLLSPACSSFDMFRDYKERGERFVQAVRELGPEDVTCPPGEAAPAPPVRTSAVVAAGEAAPARKTKKKGAKS